MQQLTRAEVIELRKLTDRHERHAQKEYLVEGEKVVKEAAEAAIITSLLMTEGFFKENQTFLQSLPILEKNYRLVSPEGMKQLSGVVTPPGIMGVATMPRVEWEDIIGAKKLVCFLDVADPGNLGTMLRTADWFGVRHFLLTSQSVDPYNDKVVRSAMGSLFRSVLYQSTDIQSDLQALKEKGVSLIATDSHGDSQDLPNHLPWCLIMGSESHGTPAAIRDQADYHYTIPGEGPTESLNVAISFGITLANLAQK